VTTDAEVVAAVRAYRQVRQDAGHMNVHVHAQGMRAALEAAEKVRSGPPDYEGIHGSGISDLRRNLTHNHSTTNMATLGLRPPGQCSACDYERGIHR